MIPFPDDSPFPLREGNSVRLLVDGGPAFRRICEAIETATERVWVTVTFMWPGFQMPNGHGSALDALARAAARGVDVRVVFWRPEPFMDAWLKNAFWGSDEHLRQLEGTRLKVRWDMAIPGHCQHQKSWLVDEIAFVGGINLNPNSVVERGRPGGGGNHDIYVELTGPAVMDVETNFIERWNEANGGGSPTHCPLPVSENGEGVMIPGNALVQIQRTKPPDELTNYRQYVHAIRAARNSIYIENQSIAVPEILKSLVLAARKGVDIVLLMPAEPDPMFLRMTRENPALIESWEELKDLDNFTIVGIAGLTESGERMPVYVHSKIMLIDDEWATVGSCNLHRFSLFGNAELNAAIWHAESVKSFRVELFQEHLDLDTSALNARDAVSLFQNIAKANRSTEPSRWQGLAFELDVPS